LQRPGRRKNRFIFADNLHHDAVAGEDFLAFPEQDGAIQGDLAVLDQFFDAAAGQGLEDGGQVMVDPFPVFLNPERKFLFHLSF
jgi:hypothetical protein